MHKLTQELTIQPFQPEYQVEVRDLILAGLVEHWGRLNPRKNPDLDDIWLTYAQAVFLVAVHQGRIIATGALIPKTNATGEIVRMSVAADMRRRGVGGRILKRLTEEARSIGVRQLLLETTETWQDAIEFYTHFGFKITQHLNGDVYFMLDL